MHSKTDRTLNFTFTTNLPRHPKRAQGTQPWSLTRDAAGGSPYVQLQGGGVIRFLNPNAKNPNI